jgi:hypothetical protein
MPSRRSGDGGIALHPQKIVFALLNLIAGTAVLASYAWGATAWPAETVTRLWGDVPEAVRPWYSSWMFVAATGYLVYAGFLFFRVDADRARVAGRYGFGLFNALLVLILVPSAVWMPLTLHHIEHPSSLSWLAIVVGLWTTGLASLAMIGALAALEPREPQGWARASLVGAMAFAGQTFVLDSCVWPLLFPY